MVWCNSYLVNFQLFSRLIKLSWFDTSKDERLIFQDSIGEVKQFIDVSVIVLKLFICLPNV